MDIYTDKIAGSEFDWFAQDISGNIALFSTAGEGFVPQIVINNYEQLSSVSESIETPNWGSKNIWLDYAKIGLYVYDWCLPGGPYIRKECPKVSLSTDLQRKLVGIYCLYRFEFDFMDMLKVENA